MSGAQDDGSLVPYTSGEVSSCTNQRGPTSSVVARAWGLCGLPVSFFSSRLHGARTARALGRSQQQKEKEEEEEDEEEEEELEEEL